MAKIFHVVEQGTAIAGPFLNWSAAQAWMMEHSSGDAIEGTEDPTEPDFASNPEPQEMTASWARRMARSA
jgi:hypothetical protein